MKFRHVGSTEEFVDKSQEIRVKNWTSGMNVNFKEGERVVHPFRGPGEVTLIMPDGRRIVKYDTGDLHMYSPGKTLWKFRLEKANQGQCARKFCCCFFPVTRSHMVDAQLMTIYNKKPVKAGDRICQNEHGTGTVLETYPDGGLKISYDSSSLQGGTHEPQVTIVRAGSDPNMVKVKQYTLCPCLANYCWVHPSSAGVINGHDADEDQNIADMAQGMNEVTCGHC